MALLTLEGIYEDGKIELEEKPVGVKRSHVVITFLPDSAIDDNAARKLAERRQVGVQLLETMRAGIDFGGDKFDREELYDDRMDELDSRRGRH